MYIPFELSHDGYIPGIYHTYFTSMNQVPQGRPSGRPRREGAGPPSTLRGGGLEEARPSHARPQKPVREARVM